MPNSEPTDPETADWAQVHEAALKRGDHYYFDPTSGLLVMTELSHLERGTCCGKQCRHCPFDHRDC